MQEDVAIATLRGGIRR